MKVEVLEIRMLAPGKPLRAFVDIKVGDWLICDFRIMKRNEHRTFVSPPQVSWKDPMTGEIKYKPILTFPADQKQAIDVAILAAYYQRETESSRDDQKK